MSRPDTALRTLRWVIVVGLVMGALGLCWWKWQYPFGQRGCALPCMLADLDLYAKDHDGWFPNSSSNALAALSSLYPEYSTNPNSLAGISGDREKVYQLLRSGQALSEAACSWVYIQGLRLDDDNRLALLWDRSSGIDAVGRRSPKGGRAVGFVDGHYSQIAEDEWEAFLQQQEELRKAAQSKRSAQTNGAPDYVR